MIPNTVGGTEYHLRSFLTQLERKDKRNTYVVFCNGENFRSFHFINPRWKKVHCPIRASFRPARILYEQFVLPFLVKRYQCDVLHSFGYFGPVICPAKHIITIHDVNWRDCPEDFSFVERWVTGVLIELNLRFSYRIMTVSEFTKRRLVHYFPNITYKIRVIPSWVSEEFIKESKRVHKLPTKRNKYILSVNAMYPHKRVMYLLDLWKEMSKKDTHLALILIGKNGKDEKHVLDRIRNLDRIHYYPKVSLPSLVAFYQHATAYLSPSVYEGFGFSVYEALSVGGPIVVGKIELYSQKMHKYLVQFTFNKLIDIQVIEQLMRNSDKQKHSYILNSSQESVRKLILLYESII